MLSKINRVKTGRLMVRKGGKLEDWKIGMLEYFYHGGTENTEKHREGRIEDWKIGRLERWKFQTGDCRLPAGD